MPNSSRTLHIELTKREFTFFEQLAGRLGFSSLNEMAEYELVEGLTATIDSLVPYDQTNEYYEKWRQRREAYPWIFKDNQIAEAAAARALEAQEVKAKKEEGNNKEEVSETNLHEA